MIDERQETVADIAKMMRRNEEVFHHLYWCEYADRIEAAHQREVDELRKCLMEAVTKVCNRLEKCGFKEPCVFKTCYVQKWRKALQDKKESEVKE